VDPATAARDLQIAHAGGPELLLLVPRAPEDGVRMRIDEAGGEHALLAVDHLGAGMRRPELGVGGHREDAPVRADRHTRALPNPGVPLLHPAAGAGRPGTRHHL